MWLSDDITIEIDEAEGSVVIIVVETPVGSFKIAGAVSLVDGVLTIDRAHIDGLAPGVLTRAGLNAVGYKILEVTGADSLDLQGSTRTSGRNADRAPRRIRFPR